MDNKIEYILCAAIWYKDGKEYTGQPVNIITGIVVPGYRHEHCIKTLGNLLNISYEHLNLKNEDMGFLTSKFRFVSRAEARNIALEANQISIYNEGTQLISEELY